MRYCYEHCDFCLSRERRDCYASASQDSEGRFTYICDECISERAQPEVDPNLHETRAKYDKLLAEYRELVEWRDRVLGFEFNSGYKLVKRKGSMTKEAREKIEA